MSEINKVTVLICGQEYTLSGDMPREYIMKLADKVDEKMTEISGGNNQTLSKTAVLAAMLIADEYYTEKAKAEKLALEKDELERQSNNYESLWEEAKTSFTEYKEEQENTIEQLKSVIASQEARYADTQNVPPEAAQRIEELENRCKDIESSFFDLQMENIRLMNELENYKKDF
ncbi:MAG: cell division protein ZapA [Firmicutes bacterium]|jgi:cell division protein ZapA|nr:cell division protein ZapA [Bacillota bacterium]